MERAANVKTSLGLLRWTWLSFSFHCFAYSALAKESRFEVGHEDKDATIALTVRGPLNVDDYRTSATVPDHYVEAYFKNSRVFGIDGTSHKNLEGRNFIKSLSARWSGKTINVPLELCYNVTTVWCQPEPPCGEITKASSSNALLFHMGVGDGGGSTDVYWEFFRSGKVRQYGVLNWLNPRMETRVVGSIYPMRSLVRKIHTYGPDDLLHEAKIKITISALDQMEVQEAKFIWNGRTYEIDSTYLYDWQALSYEVEGIPRLRDPTVALSNDASSLLITWDWVPPEDRRLTYILHPDGTHERFLSQARGKATH